MILPLELSEKNQSRLLTEDEWRALGVQMSKGWVHYAIHQPEPHILLFRRPHGTDPNTGQIDQEEAKKTVEKYHLGLLV